MRFLIIASFYLLFLLFAIPAANSPLTYDEVSCLLPAQSLLVTGEPRLFTEKSVVTTRLHIDIQSLLYRLLGVSNFSSRVMGILCVLFQLLIFSFLGETIFKEPPARRRFLFFSCLLFVTNPAVIQGSLIPFEDTTLLPIGISVFALFFLKFKDRMSLGKSATLGILFAIALWPKITTPWVIIAAMATYFFLNRNAKDVFYTLVIAITGVILFLIYWILYAGLNGLDWFEPINYYFLECFRKQASCHELYNSPYLFYMPAFVRIFLWAGFYSLALAALAVIGRIKNFIKSKSLGHIDFLIIYALLAGIGYFLIVGTVFGFPKYHYPVFFALAAISAFIAAKYWGKVSRKDLVFYSGLTAAAFVYLWFFAGDLIYIFNFKLKDVMINNPLMFKKTLLYFIYKYALYLLPGGAVFLIIKRLKKNYAPLTQAVISLVIMICASNLSLNLIQLKADYMTRLCYGAGGTGELVGYLKENLSPGETALVTNDIIYYLQDKNVPYPAHSPWRDLDTMMRRVEEPRVKFVVYSVTHHTACQFRDIFSQPVFISKLKKNFVFREIGTYKVWERKKSGVEKE